MQSIRDFWGTLVGKVAILAGGGTICALCVTLVAVLATDSETSAEATPEEAELAEDIEPPDTESPPTDTEEPTPAPASLLTATAANAAGEVATVTRIIDGDTLEVTLNGRTERVRYIGIDTPETNQECGADATAFNASLVEGQEVIMVNDVSNVDQFGRLLRYVFVNDLFINAELVAQGYAEAVQFPPDITYAEHFQELEGMAVEADIGCHPSGVFIARQGATTGGSAPTSPPVSTVPPATAPVSTLPPPTAPPPTEVVQENPWPGCPAITCGGFSSCGQVYEYLSFCPQYWGARDGDSDGVPCESLCG